MATMAPAAGVYGWLIVPDEGVAAPVDSGVFGPASLGTALRERLLGGHGERFRMGERTCRGDQVYLQGRFLGATTVRHTPLTEYGYPWSGATWIEYERTGTWVRLRTPWGAWVHSRWRHRRYWLSQATTTLLHTIGRHVWNPDRSQCLRCGPRRCQS